MAAAAAAAAAVAVAVPRASGDNGDGDKHRSADVALEGGKRRRVWLSPRSARGEAHTELLAGVRGRGVLCCGVVVGDCCRLPTTPIRLGVLCCGVVIVRMLCCGVVARLGRRSGGQYRDI